MKTKQLILLFILISCFSGILFAQKVTVKIFPEVKKQVIQSIGGNYC